MRRREALLALMTMPLAQKEWWLSPVTTFRWHLDGMKQFEVVFQGETIVIPIEEVFRALKGE